MHTFLVEKSFNRGPVTQNQKRKTFSSYSARSVSKKQKKSLQSSLKLWSILPTLRNSEALTSKQCISDRFPLGFNHVNLPEHYKKNIVTQVVRAKEDHPDAIVFVKSGCFFNACGIDAVLCMEYCPLMSRQKTANVGAHGGKIQSIIDMLLSENIEVVIVEKEKGKEYTRQLINKFNPIYFGSDNVHEMVGDIPVRIAIISDGDSCDIHVIDDMEATIDSYHNLHLSTLSIITDMYPSNQLYCMGKCLGGKDTIHLDWSCDRGDFLKKILYYELTSTIEYTTTAHSDIAQRCTIEQLGLLPNNSMRGVPSLLDAICPDVGKKCKEMVSKMLVCPPPVSVAELFRKVIKKYTMVTAIPKPPSKILPLHGLLLMLRKRKANAAQLRNVYQHFKWMSVMVEDDFLRLANLTHALCNSSEADVRDNNHRLIADAIGIEADEISQPEFKLVIRVEFRFELDMINTCEKWHGNVSKNASAAFNRTVFEARSKYRGELLAAFSASDLMWNAEIFEVVSTERIGNGKLAKDKKGNALKGKFRNTYTIPQVHTSRQRYLNACEAAQQKADQILHELNASLCEKTLTFAQNLWCWNRIIYSHISANSSWNAAEIVDAERPVLQLNKFKPFWLNSSAVSNSIDLNSIQLLSGANTGGKSTVCRSVAGIALLAKAGFLTPADKCIVSQGLDVFLNVGNADCATSGLSGFAAFTADMSSLLKLNKNGNHVLAIVDEMSAGTSTLEGSNICIAYITALSKTNTIGLVSTHFDDVLRSSELINLPKIQMANDNGNFSYKLTDGVCDYRYATQVMRELLIPENICDHADELIARSITVKKTIKLSALEIVVQKLGDFYVCLGKNMQCSVIESSCMYLLKCEGGFYYVGESDNVGQRYKTHFASKKKPVKMYIWRMDNKSLARKMETEITSILKRKGIPLLSTNDGDHSHFGGN
jgi:DNA mismatch repair ATPase MutS/predicted GIY-YIG superfamily endonuclease